MNNLEFIKLSNMLVDEISLPLFRQYVNVIFSADNCKYIIRNLIGKLAAEGETNHMDMSKEIGYVKNVTLKEVMAVTRTDRHADTYRRFYDLMKDWGEDYWAKKIALAQTMPYTELDSPGWVDPYTGYIDEEEFFLANTNIRSVKVKASADDPRYQELFSEYWSLEEYQMFLDAQEGFNEVFDEIELLDDDHDTKVWQYSTMQNDELPTSESGECSRRYGKNRKVLLQMVEAAESTGMMDELKGMIRSSNEFKKITYIMQYLARENYSPADILNPITFLLEDYGLTLTDLKKIKLPFHSTGNLKSWYLTHGLNLRENNERDSMGQMVDADEMFVEKFCEETLNLYVQNIALPDSSDVTKSPAFVEAYLHNVLNKRDTSKAKALTASWDAWRASLDPEAASAYRKVKNITGSHKEANKVFFKMYSRYNITSLGSKTMTLTSPNPKAYVPSKKVSIRQAAAMLKSGLIRLDAEGKKRLTAKLAELNVEQEVVALFG